MKVYILSVFSGDIHEGLHRKVIGVFDSLEQVSKEKNMLIEQMKNEIANYKDWDEYTEEAYEKEQRVESYKEYLEHGLDINEFELNKINFK